MTACLSLNWLENLLIWAVTLVVVVGVLKILVPWLFSMLGVDGGKIVQIINLIVLGVVAIAVIVFVFALLSCLLPIGHYR